MGKISGKDIVKRMLERKDLKYFSQDLGIPNQTISNWKTRNAPPKAEELLKIAIYLDVSIEWLLTGQERAAPKIPPEILDTAYEIYNLPDVYRKIVLDTVRTLKKDVIEKEKEKGLDSSYA